MQLIRLVGVFAVFGVALAGSRAEAQFESRSNASVCLNQANWVYQMADGLTNLTGATSTTVCPFVDDIGVAGGASGFLRFSPPPTIRNINFLNVHGNKVGSSGLVTVSACVKAFGSNSFTCGLSANTATAGQYALAVDRSAWRTFFGDFAYLQVTLTANSSISGWWVST